MKHTLLRLLAILLVSSGLFSCSPNQAGSPAADSNSLARGKARSAAPSAEANRPGLATGWGQQKSSITQTRDFNRASSKPAGTDAIYYNSIDGIDATASSSRVQGLQTAAGDMIEWGIKGRVGLLSTYKEYNYRQDDRRFVSGKKGSDYTIVVRNRCKSALEIVASVDGLDVMDGKTATFSKRGYIVQPGERLEIAGFRTSQNSVAAFKFSSVANSYANLRHGDTRNVGVIGLAVFTQKGVNPWTWTSNEIDRRNQAQPFATAPGN